MGLGVLLSPCLSSELFCWWGLGIMAGVIFTSVILLLGLRSFAGAREPSTLQRDVLRGVVDLDGPEFSRPLVH